MAYKEKIITEHFDKSLGDNTDVSAVASSHNTEIESQLALLQGGSTETPDKITVVTTIITE